MDVLNLTFLGTASAYPSPHRCVSCTALHHDKGVWLFDCGEGSQVQLMKSPLKPGKVSKIFITHLHGDHLYGLPGLLCTISKSNQRTEPVEIYGPLGLRHYLCTALNHSRSDIDFFFTVIEMKPLPCQDPPDVEVWPVEIQTHIPFVPSEKPGRIVEPDESEIWHLFSDKTMSVRAVWLKHRVPSFAFVLQESEKPGKLDVGKLKGLGVPPGPVYSKIKSGVPITLDSGQQILPDDVMGEPTPGRLVVISGDSSDSHQLKKIAMKATVFVHEATLDKSLEAQCVENGHSTPTMTATLAKELSCKHLILTHFSQRYKALNAELKDGEQSVQILLDEALQILEPDKVTIAHDLMTYQIPRL